MVLFVLVVTLNKSVESERTVATTRPHFRRVGDLHAPMIFHHLLMKLNRSEIEIESKAIFSSLLGAYEGYVGHERASKSQAKRALWHLEEAQKEASATSKLVFGMEIDFFARPIGNKSIAEKAVIITDNNISRSKRQVFELAAVAGLGLGIYNLYELETLKAQMAVENEAVLRMSEMTRHLEKTLFSVVEDLNVRQYGERLQTALAQFHHFWTDLASVFLNVMQGNAVPALKSAWFQKVIMTTLTRMIKIGAQDGCEIKPGIHSLLLFRAKGVRTTEGVEFYLPVPCVAAQKPLFKMDQVVRIAGRKQDNSTTLFDIVSSERFIAHKDGEYVILSEGDLISCEKVGTNFFCADIKESVTNPDQYCIGNLWLRNSTMIRSTCEMVPSKARVSFIQTMDNEYVFFVRDRTTMSCRNGTQRIWTEGVERLSLSPGCEIKLGSGLKITNLKSSTTVIEGQKEAGWHQFEVMQFYEKELGWLKKGEALLSSPSIVATGHVMMIVHLVLFLIALAIFGWRYCVGLRNQRIRRRRRRQRLELEGLEMEDLNPERGKNLG